MTAMLRALPGAVTKSALGRITGTEISNYRTRCFNLSLVNNPRMRRLVTNKDAPLRVGGFARKLESSSHIGPIRRSRSKQRFEFDLSFPAWTGAFRIGQRHFQA